MNTNKHNLDEVWDYVEGQGNPVLDDICSVERGEISDETADEMIARGQCVACRHFADNAMIHESPGHAKCCIGCPAHNGLTND